MAVLLPKLLHPLATRHGLVRAGAHVPRSVVSVARGVHVPLDQWNRSTPWERYHLMISARAVAGTAPVFCCATALFLYGLPLGRLPHRIFEARPTRANAGAMQPHAKHRGSRMADAPSPFVHVHPGLEPVQVGDFAVMPLHEAAARVCGAEPMEVSIPVADALLASTPGGTSAAELRAQILGHVQELTFATHRRQAQGVLAFADARSESPGESLSRVALARVGAKPPVLQRTFRDARGDIRPDFLWPEERVSGDFDGRGKYLGQQLRGHERDEWDVLRAEKERDQRLRSLGLVPLHWTSETLRDPAHFARILREAGVPVDPRRATELR